MEEERTNLSTVLMVSLPELISKVRYYHIAGNFQRVQIFVTFVGVHSSTKIETMTAAAKQSMLLSVSLQHGNIVAVQMSLLQAKQAPSLFNSP